MLFPKMLLIITESICSRWQNSREFFHIWMMLSGGRLKKTNLHPCTVWQLYRDIGNNNPV